LEGSPGHTWTVEHNTTQESCRERKGGRIQKEYGSFSLDITLFLAIPLCCSSSHGSRSSTNLYTAPFCREEAGNSDVW